ncbi:MAG: hypothetical protein RLZZ384_548 [Pseudomonadota bacterium]|jgi:DNA-binding transcriptional regulator YdaS (Cro superfamily)
MEIEKIIEFFGTQYRLAKALNIKPQNVTQWIAANQIPLKQAINIEKASNGKITREQIRPDIYER